MRVGVSCREPQRGEVERATMSARSTDHHSRDAGGCGEGSLRCATDLRRRRRGMRPVSAIAGKADTGAKKLWGRGRMPGAAVPVSSAPVSFRDAEADDGVGASRIPFRPSEIGQLETVSQCIAARVGFDCRIWIVMAQGEESRGGKINECGRACRASRWRRCDYRRRRSACTRR